MVWLGSREKDTTFLDPSPIFTLPSPLKISTGRLQCVMRVEWQKAVKAKAENGLSLEGETRAVLLLLYPSIVFNFTNPFFLGSFFLCQILYAGQCTEETELIFSLPGLLLL